MIQLFSTLGCHLCDEAKAIVDPLLVKHGLSCEDIEITDRNEWVDAYGVRIPVLLSSLTGSELGWPFNVVDCEKWLLENS